MPPPGQDPGPFLSLLDWLNTAGEVPLNIARGRPGAAGRKALDFLGSIPDAALPGNWIPEFSTEEDDVTASEVLGIDPMRNPAGAKVADIIGGTVANPLSYVGLRGGTLKAGVPFTEGTAIPGVSSLVDKGKELAGAAWGKLPETVTEPLAEGARATGERVRRTLNWLDVPDEGEALLRQASGAGYQAARTGEERLREIYKGLTPAELEAVGEIAHGINRGGHTDRAAWSVLSDADQYLAGRTDIRPDVVKQAAQARRELMDTLWSEGQQANVFSPGSTTGTPGYISRQFSGDYFKDVEDPMFTFRKGAASGALKGREEALSTPEGLLRFMQQQPDVDLDFNALSADARRAAAQGRLVEKAAIGKNLTGIEGFSLAMPEHQAAVKTAIEDIAKGGQRDYAYKLQQAFQGQTPRGKNWFSQGLHGANKAFKGAATYGILLPRIGFSVRNRIGGMWQALSNEQARGTLGGNAQRAFSDLMGAFDDGYVKLGGSRLTGSELTKSIDHIDQSFRAAGGSVNKFRELLKAGDKDGYLQEALDNRVLDDFVSSEQLMGELQRTPAKQRTMDILTWPAAIARGVEQRMRIGTYMDLRKSGVSAQDAAKTVRDTYLDYSVPGLANRTFRDIIPFGAFLSQNVKQQAKFLAAQPSVAVATSQLYGQDEGLPKYPWLEQQMAIPTGLDEQGNAQYLTSFGLPIEGLTAVPGLGASDLYRDVVGSMQPLLKTGIAYAVDKDPFTGRDFGEYDKIMNQEAGKLGRAYNVLMGTGLTQAVGTPMGQIANLADERKSIAERALQFGTGMRFTSVDPDLAERQQLEDYLNTRPDIRTAPTYYQTGEDDEVTQLLKDLRDAKARLKAKREASAAL